MTRRRCGSTTGLTSRGLTKLTGVAASLAHKCNRPTAPVNPALLPPSDLDVAIGGKGIETVNRNTQRVAQGFTEDEVVAVARDVHRLDGVAREGELGLPRVGRQVAADFPDQPVAGCRRP